MAETADAFRRQSRLLIRMLPFGIPGTFVTFLLTFTFASAPTPILHWLAAACAAAISFWLIWIPWLKRRDTSRYPAAGTIAFVIALVPALTFSYHLSGVARGLATIQYIDIYAFFSFMLILPFKSNFTTSAGE